MAVPTGLWNIDQVEVLQPVFLNYMTLLFCTLGRMQHIQKFNISNCRREELFVNRKFELVC
jgi:hypothetical protein